MISLPFSLDIFASSRWRLPSRLLRRAVAFLAALRAVRKAFFGLYRQARLNSVIFTLLLVDNCIRWPSLNSYRTHFLPVIFSIGSDPNNRNKNSLTTLIHFSHIYSHTYPNLYISFLTPSFIRLTTIVNPYIYIFVSHSYLFSKIKKYFQNKKYNLVLLDNWINISNFYLVRLGNTDYWA